MRTSTYVLEEKEAARLSSGSQAIKREWTYEQRAKTAIDGPVAHELIEQAEPFDIWKAVAR